MSFVLQFRPRKSTLFSALHNLPLNAFGDGVDRWQLHLPGLTPTKSEVGLWSLHLPQACLVGFTFRDMIASSLFGAAFGFKLEAA